MPNVENAAVVDEWEKAKEGLPEVSRRDGGQPLRKENEFFRQVDVADVLQGLDLLT